MFDTIDLAAILTAGEAMRKVLNNDRRYVTAWNAATAKLREGTG